MKGQFLSARAGVPIRILKRLVSVRLFRSTLFAAICAVHVSSAGADSPPLPDSSLADAAERQDDRALQILLNENSNVNAAQVDGMTALHWAVYHDSVALTEKLLDAGAAVSAKNRYGVQPLTIACMNGNARIVELLLKKGAGVDTSVEGGETVLMTAARTGKVEPVRLLLDHGADVNAKESAGQTAIMWAAADGHVEVVEALIRAGADFRTPLKSGFTPFFFAVREGRIPVVKTLLAAGAEFDDIMVPQSPTGKSVRKGTSALILAIENGHFELATLLLDAGADPNDQRSGFTPLHTLTWVRKPNRGDGDDGDPPPVGSGEMSSLEFAPLLVLHGADVNARLASGSSGTGRLNRKGCTPFLLAAVTADVPYMELLIELGADPQIANVDGCTPLMAAAGLGTLAPGEEAGTESEAVDAVLLTLQHGGSINTVDANGETAMHGAAYKSLPGVVRLLTEKGADISVWNQPNKYGWTPVLIAEGFRPGNFKPAPETLAALHESMRQAGITPPPLTPRPAVPNNTNYAADPPPKLQKRSSPN